MAVNTLTFEQSAAFLTALYEQATGRAPLTAVDAGNFVSVAQTVLQTGYDNVINSISQVIGRTIFSIRPYSAKFKGMDVTDQKFGAITRKINFVDGALENDDRMTLVDGQSVDPWRVNKPKILQTNFYGATQYQKSITIFRDQLDAAFQSADEFSRFISGVMQNVEDQLEQVREEEARACLINLITGVAATPNNTARYIDVLQKYNAEAGVTLTLDDVFNPDNFVPFTKWLYSFVNRLTRQLSERSQIYHTNVTGKEVMRHTPADKLKAYMSANVLDAINSVALPTVFGADRLKMIDFEGVTYWQNIQNPTSVQAKPTILNANGTLTTVATAVSVPNIVGVLFDEEAAGITRCSTWQAATPFNPRGGYTNIFWHFTQKLWNDFTENAVVLYMGEE